jgi:hypothetical protein
MLFPNMSRPSEGPGSLANADHVEETSMFITPRLEAFPLVRLLFMV